MRIAAARPLGPVARAAATSRPQARTFASTALRAKEVAGGSTETPNMRVRISRRLPLSLPPCR